ncbi:hypothetical protein OWR29_44525 [Actinoplanes sp. Pm04-4]|uniref:Uncharacterized protein n=1 Tax=Paractinoplanes pyxinae TaxID=2997416 RepID=A0ABT4BHN3_9ACTN|nr:hypothetical protein [Actinoplanes pyxinae]MCY1145110.1 hypothetical protein [Actinoplanes pyxinae]
MDVTQRSRRRGWVIVGALVVILAIVVAFRVLRQDPPAEPAPVGEAADVGFGESSGGTYAQETKDFVLQFDLRNNGGALVHVRAANAFDDKGFARLALAVLPGFAAGSSPSYDDVVAGGGKVIPLDPGSTAQLTVAGRLTCDPLPASRDGLDVRVDDRTVRVALPPVDDQPWSVAVARELCP